MTATSFDVQWTLGDTEMDGTVVVPATGTPLAAVVMIAGSGPTNRDWCSPLLPGDNGSARLLAEALAQHGVASMRYDKRASGPRAAENVPRIIQSGGISMRSHADEVTGAVQRLVETPGIPRDRIFALTNSEGTLHALNYQLASPAIPFAGLVLTGAPGRAVGAIARTQLGEQLSPIPGGAQMLAHYDEAIVRWTAGEPMNAEPSLPQGVRNLLDALAAPMNQPFSRELWIADASELLARVDVPTLVIIGKKDIQCDWRLDGEPLERATRGRANVTIAYPANANHVLKHEPASRESLAAADVMVRYNAPTESLDAETVATIADWLTARGTAAQ